MEFYKKWSIENKIDFVNSLATPQNERAYQVQKFQEQERLNFFHFLKGWRGLNITKSLMFCS
jgi:non-specific serine/threonine protein kinase